MEKLFNELEWLKRQFSQGKWDLISGYVKKNGLREESLAFLYEQYENGTSKDDLLQLFLWIFKHKMVPDCVWKVISIEFPQLILDAQYGCPDAETEYNIIFYTLKEKKYDNAKAYIVSRGLFPETQKALCSFYYSLEKQHKTNDAEEIISLLRHLFCSEKNITIIEEVGLLMLKTHQDLVYFSGRKYSLPLGSELKISDYNAPEEAIDYCRCRSREENALAWVKFFKDMILKDYQHLAADILYRVSAEDEAELVKIHPEMVLARMAKGGIHNSSLIDFIFSQNKEFQDKIWLLLNKGKGRIRGQAYDYFCKIRPDNEILNLLDACISYNIGDIVLSKQGEKDFLARMDCPLSQNLYRQQCGPKGYYYEKPWWKFWE